MKNLLAIVLIILLTSSIVNGQTYTDISFFDVYQKGWALVKKDSLYGFIDENGVEVIPAKNKHIPKID